MYKETIGLEIHLELKTNTKAFSAAANEFKALPNTAVSLGDMAYPGTLPLVSDEIINQGIRAALLLNCKIPSLIHFDRKNYFYPDLSKGYQITQNRTPIGTDGYIILDSGKKIGIHDIHLEEDTAKSIHSEDGSLLDFNRSGVPLIEIVSKPDISNSFEAREYLEKLRELMVFAGISDCKIEEGSMRCDVNISVSKTDKLGNRAEIKNVSSFTAVENAINYEKERQIKLIEAGGEVQLDTRRFDQEKNKTISLRIKGTGDYRYFPEPDIPWISITNERVEKIKNTLAPAATDIKKVLVDSGVPEINANKILAAPDLALFLAKYINEDINFVQAVNLLLGDILSHLNKRGISLAETKLSKKRFTMLLNSFNEGLTLRIFRDIAADFLDTDKSLKTIMDEKGIKLIDEETLKNIIEEVIDESPEAVSDYLGGNERTLKYLMGMVMKKSKGGADPNKAEELIIKRLSK